MLNTSLDFAPAHSGMQGIKLEQNTHQISESQPEPDSSTSERCVDDDMMPLLLTNTVDVASPVELAAPISVEVAIEKPAGPTVNVPGSFKKPVIAPIMKVVSRIILPKPSFAQQVYKVCNVNVVFELVLAEELAELAFAD